MVVVCSKSCYSTSVQATNVEEIIRKERAISCCSARFDMIPFEKLELLVLEGLEELKTIYWEALPFPELKEIKIRSCPHLRRLLINSASAQGHTLVISAEKEWIQELEWEDEEAKQRLFSN
ncbi:unnamed protein product [Arabis nemorensis]|uniref:NB-ARC domain-containing protein n=1 Tax=Arabis nemorensis TaxID=586526 RepID=A0A565CDS3_9BRAS|nr:unnamed protein product [Arabis nemorensis]